MVTCPNCGRNTPEGRFCELCGAQLVTVQQPAYPPYTQPAGTVPAPFPDAKSTQRSFHYSGLFYAVVILDLVASFIFGAIGVYGFSIETGKYYPDTFGLLLAIFLMVFFSIEIILDFYLIRNRVRTPRSIDINLCWVKSLCGFIGVITLISGLYFFIIAMKMHDAHEAGHRQ